MNIRLTIATVILMVAYSSVWADCDSALVPTVETAQSEYKVLQAFMSVNSSEEYERLQRMSSGSRGAEASYKFFDAEYRDSQTSSEFKKKIDSRLLKEDFKMTNEAARAVYRKGPTDVQVAAWVTCKTIEGDNASSATGVLLRALGVTPDDFTLRIDWKPGIGVPPKQIAVVRLTDATVNGENTLDIPFDGRGSYDLTVHPTLGKKVVRATVNIGGHFSDTVVVDIPPRTKICAEKDPCGKSEDNFVRVLQCLPSNETPKEFARPSEWLSTSEGPSSPNRTEKVEFGDWINLECGISGTGWHVKVGTCGTGKGTAWNRCSQVRVEVK